MRKRKRREWKRMKGKVEKIEEKWRGGVTMRCRGREWKWKCEDEAEEEGVEEEEAVEIEKLKEGIGIEMES